MANSLKIKSGTRAQIEAAAGASGLTAGAPYLITDEGRIAVGTGAGTFSAMALQAEITSEQRRIGQYTSTDTTTDINVAAWGIVPFNQVISEDDGFSLWRGCERLECWQVQALRVHCIWLNSCADSSSCRSFPERNVNRTNGPDWLYS